MLLRRHRGKEPPEKPVEPISKTLGGFAEKAIRTPTKKPVKSKQEQGEGA